MQACDDWQTGKVHIQQETRDAELGQIIATKIEADPVPRVQQYPVGIFQANQGSAQQKWPHCSGLRFGTTTARKQTVNGQNCAQTQFTECLS